MVETSWTARGPTHADLFDGFPRLRSVVNAASTDSLLQLVLITQRENFVVHSDNQILMTLQHLTLPTI